MKEFTYATETILEIIDEAIRNNDMEKFDTERSHAASDSYIAHIEAVDARNKAESDYTAIFDWHHCWNKEELDYYYEEKTSLLYDISRTLSKLISQVHNLEEINTEIEEIEAKEIKAEEAEHECGE